MKKTILTIMVSLAATVWAAPILDIDFTAAEGFSDGVALNGIQGFNAQAAWVATNTAGSGSAIYPNGGYSRARTFDDFMLEVGGSVVIETTFRLTSVNWPSTDGYYFGFAEEVIDSGGSTPSIGSKIHSNGDGSFWIGSSDSAQRVDAPAAASNDWIQFTQTITRSATSNEFTGTVSATNLTAGTDLGSSSNAWTQSTADGSWGGVMNASFRGVHGGGVEIEIDRWTVSTIVPPIPVTVSVDATRTRSIGGVNSLDRHTWFGVYHEAGFGNKLVEGKKVDEWIYEEGRMWPSRGTMGYGQFPEDPARDSFINPVAISNYNGPLPRYVTAKAYDPNHKTVFSGRGQGDYPDYMCWPTNQTPS